MKSTPICPSALATGGQILGPSRALLQRAEDSRAVSMSSWADEADDNQAPDFADLPPKKSGWGNVEKVQPAGLVFEDFEVSTLFRRCSRRAVAANGCPYGSWR